MLKSKCCLLFLSNLNGRKHLFYFVYVCKFHVDYVLFKKKTIKIYFLIMAIIFRKYKSRIQQKSFILLVWYNKIKIKMKYLFDNLINICTR